MSRLYKNLKQVRDALFAMNYPGEKPQPYFSGNARQRRVAWRKWKREEAR